MKKFYREWLVGFVILFISVSTTAVIHAPTPSPLPPAMFQVMAGGAARNSTSGFAGVQIPKTKTTGITEHASGGMTRPIISKSPIINKSELTLVSSNETTIKAGKQEKQNKEENKNKQDDKQDSHGSSKKNG